MILFVPLFPPLLESGVSSGRQTGKLVPEEMIFH